MVHYNPKVWFSMIFHTYSRQVVRTLLPALLFMGAFTLTCCYLVLDFFHLHENKFFHGTLGMHSLLGVVLGLFLVFRTNSAYERWWEGRKVWGGFVNSTRNLALKLNAYLSSDTEDRTWFANMIPNFIFAAKEHLRSGVIMQELTFGNDHDRQRVIVAKHKPNVIAAMLYERVNNLYIKKQLSGDQMINLDKELKDFNDLMGASERIRNTPIPYSYTMYIKKFIFIYIITLPFGFVTDFGYVTIPIVLLISFVLLSVELIAEEIEDPFGGDINDLPTDELSVKIKDNVHEIFGVK